MTSNELPKVEIYTDGACSGNPGPGGWGAYLKTGGKFSKMSGNMANTTNNKMEIIAVIKALKILKVPCEVNLYTDSSYVHQGITKWSFVWQRNKWLKQNKQPVKNSDLWQLLIKEAARHQVNWHWVKGHAGNEGNIIADALAVEACKKLKKSNVQNVENV